MAPMRAFPPELRGYRIIVIGSSMFLFGVGVVALFVALSPNRPGGAAVFFVLFALLAFVVSGFGLVFVPRWYRRAAYVVSTVIPLPGAATLTLESDFDSTSLYATITARETSTEVLSRVALLIPRWDVRPHLETPLSVDLHVDPSTSRLMAISSKHGVLWCMPTGQVVRTEVRSNPALQRTRSARR